MSRLALPAAHLLTFHLARLLPFKSARLLADFLPLHPLLREGRASATAPLGLGAYSLWGTTVGGEAGAARAINRR